MFPVICSHFPITRTLDYSNLFQMVQVKERRLYDTYFFTKRTLSVWESQTKFWSLRLDFVAKMASSHDATSPCDLLQGLVAGTGPIVCADLKAYCLFQVVDFAFKNAALLNAQTSL